MRRNRRRGQAIVEYILVTVMISVIAAGSIRGSGVVIYKFWTGLASVVASPCPNCSRPAPPQLN